MQTPGSSLAGRETPRTTAVQAADLIHRARGHERAGCVVEAMDCYRKAIDEASRSSTWAIEAEALRRLAVLHHNRGEKEAAGDACARSLAIAERNADDALSAEALNVQALFALDLGELDQARAIFQRALLSAGRHHEINARIEGNLGVLANVRGDLEDALMHYQHSLEAYREAGHDQGCARAYHNLGMISADRGMWADADGYFQESRIVAERLGDLHLQALCLLNHSEVYVARQQFEDAKASAERALAIFEQLGSQLDKPDVYRVIGTVYRETGKLALGESRLRAAIELATTTGSVLSQAESSRELALLYQMMGRNQEALSLLNAAHGLFRRMDARVDLVDITRKVEQLEQTFLAVVRDWGQSIESSDTYTFGHCERVASYAAEVANAMNLDEHQITTIRLGAYLHDVGKIRVPHEVLNKPGRLTNEEFEIIKMHPVWGIELLESVEFPWDIKPIIRWHHEKHDGTGYPDRLRGDEIPLGAAIIGIVDVYDALTTTRSYRGAMTHEVAVAEMQRCAHHWKPEVYEAFVKSIAKKPAPAETENQRVA